MLTMLEKPTWMTVKEADKKFFPNSYLLTHCETESGCASAGYVVAYAPMRNNGGKLSALMDELTDSNNHGEVVVQQTQDPLDGGSLLVEYCNID
jgi:hypothetical protein